MIYITELLMDFKLSLNVEIRYFWINLLKKSYFCCIFSWNDLSKHHNNFVLLQHNAIPVRQVPYQPCLWNMTRPVGKILFIHPLLNVLPRMSLLFKALPHNPDDHLLFLF